MAARTTERRYLPCEFEVRQSGASTQFVGYALTWNNKSQNMGGFREQVAPGATTKTIQEADIRALFNHDPSQVLGRNKSGTLRLAEDSRGLHYEVDMPDTSFARDLAVSMERGDVSSSSFGFQTISDQWGIDESDFPIRTLTEIALTDVSPVTYPAYLDSSSGVTGRSALQVFAEKRNLAPDDLLDIDYLRAAIRGEVEPPRQGNTLRLPAIRVLPVDPALALFALRSR